MEDSEYGLKRTVPEEMELDWDDPTDPDNPRNWPQWQRIYGTVIPALQLLVITMAVSAYVPAIPGIETHFQVGDQVANLGISLFLLGLGIGPLPIAPLSEIFGRRPVFQCALPLLMLFSIGSATAKNITTLLVCRTLASFLGSGALAVIGGTVLDIWDMNKGGSLAAVCCTITPLMGPVLGPVAAAYFIAEYHQNWRFGLWVIVIVALPIIALSFFLRESYKPKILNIRAKRRGHAPPQQRPGMEAARYVLRIALTRPLHMLLTEPLIFEFIFHFSPQHTSLAFLSVLVGLVFGMLIFLICELRVKKSVSADNAKTPAPEAHLTPALIGSILLPISLFWLAWTSTTLVHWIVPVLAGIVFGAAMVTIYFTVIVYMAHIYPPSVSASSLAAVGLLRYVMSALPPHFVVPMYQHLGAKWAGSVFAFISVALMPLPWAFWKWGEILRRRSPYDTCKL